VEGKAGLGEPREGTCASEMGLLSQEQRDSEEIRSENVTESQNGRGWKGPVWAN